MKIGNGFSQVSSLNQISGSSGFHNLEKQSHQMASYFQDGVDFPIVAAEKSGGGKGSKVEVEKGSKIRVECEGGGRPNISSLDGGGYELSCPPKDASGKGKQPTPAPQKDSPSGSPVID
jgi:hypothetical protein